MFCRGVNYISLKKNSILLKLKYSSIFDLFAMAIIPDLDINKFFSYKEPI